MLQRDACLHWRVRTPGGGTRNAVIGAKVYTTNIPTVQVGQALNVRVSPEDRSRCVVDLRGSDIKWVSRRTPTPERPPEWQSSAMSELTSHFEDANSYFEDVGAQIDSRLALMNEPNRISRLWSYYHTWRLPRHPESDRLHTLVCCIAHARNDLDFDTDLSALDALFSMSVSECDTQILEHCRRHYAILREIKRELANL